MLKRVRYFMALGAVCSVLVLVPSLGRADCGNGIVEGGEECDAGPTLYIDGDPEKGTCTTGSRCYYQFTCCKFNCQYVGTPGVPCQDGDSCSGPDLCNQVGVCLGGPAVAENTPCDDGLFCNGSEACHNGVCSSSTGDPCPATACNECQEATDSCFTPAGTTPCNNSTCVTGGTCDGAGACDGGTFNAGPCDDGLYCNGTDTCNAGSCVVHSGDPCPESSDGDDNCLESCDESADTCTGPDPEGAECDNALFCDGAADACTAGTCAGTGTVACDDGNSCTTETCDEGLDSCVAEGTSVDGTPCDDADPCTLGDVCTAGVCEGLPTVMDDFCPWSVILREHARRDQIKTGFRTSIDGDVCAGTYKVAHETYIGSDLVCDEALGTQIRLSPDAQIVEDIVSTGAGAKATPASGLLPYLFSSILNPGTTFAKNDSSGFYDFSGTHPLAAACTAVRDTYSLRGDALDLLASTMTTPPLSIATEATGTLTAENPGGLNVIDIGGNLKINKDAVLELNGGGDSATVIVLRIAGKLDMKLGSSLSFTGGLTSNNLLIYVKGKQCKLGTLVLGGGTLYCEPARLKAKGLVAWVGAMFGAGNKLQLGDYAQVHYQPFTAF